jgi:predicted CoA-substrate-specific enzyme activase
MHVIGLDMGSAFIKGVLIRDDGARFMHIEKSGRNYRETSLLLRDSLIASAGIRTEASVVLATGCGEQCIPFKADHAAEMNCLIRAVFETEAIPCVVIDMGGQTSRVVIMNKEGRPEAFNYSEKCASGSGKVLENAARVLQLSFDRLSEVAECAERIVTFTTNCAVFAESETIAAVARGERKEDIVAGLHYAISAKLSAMINKHDMSNLPIIATGGMAKDAALIRVLEQMMEKPIHVMPNPQYGIALGAALLSRGAAGMGIRSSGLL